MSYKEQRFCKRCGKPLPVGTHFNAKYCPVPCSRIVKLEQARENARRRKQTLALMAMQEPPREPEETKPSGWDPKSGETYAEYQRRTFIHPSTTKPLGEAVRIAPRRGEQARP